MMSSITKQDATNMRDAPEFYGLLRGVLKSIPES